MSGSSASRGLLGSSSASTLPTPSPPAKRARVRGGSVPPHLSSAARRIQRAYRRFRAKFPGGGRIHSRSSTEKVWYQEQPDFKDDLARGFADELKEAARMDPEARALVLATSKEVDGAWLRGAEVRGYVRAVPAMGREAARIAFSGDEDLHAWAAEGYKLAADELAQEGARDLHLRLADMLPWEVDYVLVRYQKVLAPAVVAEKLGRDPSALNLLRTVARSRSASPKYGHPRQRFVVPMASLKGVKVIGAPGDRFKLGADVVRFLDYALGGFEHYHWRFNPIRRRRVAGKGRRYLMRVNHGLHTTSAYRILRAMSGWANRVDRKRNWAALFPRPIAATGRAEDERGLRYAVYQLIRRLLLESGMLATGSRAFLPASAGHKLYTSLSSSPESPTRSETAAPCRSSVAGYLVDADHAGFFFATCAQSEDEDDARANVYIKIFDPHGATTFDQQVADAISKHAKEALADLMADGATAGLRVGFGSVPAELALQYAYEGSCGPSSLALIMSMLRLMHDEPRIDFARKRDPRNRIFASVRDEDVVLACQLVHSAIV